MTPFPLGRRLEPNHDPRSWLHPASAALRLTSARHKLYGQPLDQGEVGSCTGNATAHAKNCATLHRPFTRRLYEPHALALYARATQIDPFPGTYPPEDTGSDGLSVMKAAREAGYVGAYSHAFGLDHALAALVVGPWIMGIQWTEDMFYPDNQGFVHPTGNVVGGHELCANEIVVDAAYPGGGYIQGPQSWGAGWGLRGFYRMTFTDLRGRLAADGDVTVPRPA